MENPVYSWKFKQIKISGTLKALIQVVILLLILSPSFAQEIIQEQKIYKQVAGHELVVDVFYNQETMTNNSNPAIAFFHGGGWAFGSPSEFHGACKRYAEKGFITFSFQYRLSIDENGKTPHPDITPVECVKDARSAIRWLRENAGTLKIDPEKIVVGGQSVGGQLTLSTALANEVNESTDDLTISPVPNAMLLYSGTVNPVAPWCDYLMQDKRTQIWTISPYHNLRENLPPAIAFHGKADDVVDFWTVAFFQRETEKLGNYFELVTYEGRKHYLGANDEKGKTVYSRLMDEEILERTDDFLVKFDFMNAGPE